MKILSTSQLASAETYLNERARPLERARYGMTFRQGDIAPVINALGRFRNGDGGFGHGLEPDNRAARSSVLAATEALAVLAETGVSEGNEVLDGLLSWLLTERGGIDLTTAIWPYLPPDIDDAPHAPWWDIDTLESNFGGFVVNPRARILAYLYRWPGAASATRPDLLGRATDLIIEWCGTAADEQSPDTLRSLIMLAEAPNVPDASRDEITRHVRRMITASVVVDPASWSEYGLQPTEVADAPESRWMPLLADAVKLHLDYIVETQDEDGSWKPFWGWGDRYPDDWAAARDEWAGVLTLRYLRVLAAFGRLPGGHPR